MSRSFHNYPKGSIIGSGTRKFRHYGVESPARKSLENHTSYYTFVNNDIPETLVDYVVSFNAEESGNYTLRHSYNSDTQDIPCQLLATTTSVISSNTNIGSQSTDGGIVMIRYENGLTINSGATVSVENRTKGLFIYVEGDLVVDGTISMTARGASGTGQNIYLRKDSSSSMLYIPAIGAAGGAAVKGTARSNGIQIDGNSGSNGTNGQTGGGGAGSIFVDWSGTRTSGAGGTGTSFSGGAGGGGGGGYTSTLTAGSGSSTGGAGGDGIMAGAQASWNWKALGGIGNPGGISKAGSGGGSSIGSLQSGTGGLLCIYVTGNITIGSTGKIEANGVGWTDELFASYSTGAMGGQSGGGSVNIFAKGTITNNGSVTATGGCFTSTDTSSPYKVHTWGRGGDGTVRLVNNVN